LNPPCSRLDSKLELAALRVIARDWRRLEPVRAYAEAAGLPVDLANEACLACGACARMQGFIRACFADRTRLP